VKLPLLRVAHATDGENSQQLDKLKTTLEEHARRNKDLVANSLEADDDSLSRDISTKGVPTSEVRQR